MRGRTTTLTGTMLLLAAFGANARGADQQITTSKAFFAARQEMLQREYRGALEAVKPDPKWEAAARTFIDQLATCEAYATAPDMLRPANSLGERAVVELADKAIAQGCANPLILHLREMLVYSLTDGDDSKTLITVTPKVADLPLSPFMQARIQIDQVRAHVQNRVTKAPREEPIITLLKALPAEPAAQRVVVADLLSRLQPVWETGYVESLRNRLSQGDPQWGRLVVQGWTNLQGARSAADSAASHPQVAKPNVIQFTTTARQALAQAHELAPQLPDAAALLLEVVRIDGNADEAKKWFDAAIAAQVDCMPAWDQYATFMDARHAGSNQKVLEIANAAAAKGRFDTPLPRFVITLLLRTRDASPEFAGAPGVWATAKECIDGYINAAASPDDRDRLQSEKLAIAYRLKAWEEVKKIGDSLGAKIKPESTRLYGVRPNEAIAMSGLMLNTAIAKDVESAVAAFDAQDYVKAGAAWTAVANKLPATDPARPIVQGYRGVCDNAIALSKGQPVQIRFQPETGLIGWTGDVSDWTVQPGGILTCKADRPIKPNIRLPIPLPTSRLVHYEIKINRGRGGELPAVRLDYQDTGEGRPCGIQLNANAKGTFSWEPMRVGGPMIGNGWSSELAANKWQTYAVLRHHNVVGQALLGKRFTTFDKLPQEFFQGAPSIGIGVELKGNGDSVEIRLIGVQKKDG